VTWWDTGQPGNWWVSLHDLSGRPERVMPGRISGIPTINPRDARIETMRFGVSEARAANSSEPKHGGDDSPGRDFLEIHGEPPRDAG
jgi:hypothetical protein